jgi:WD40 repeat protein
VVRSGFEGVLKIWSVAEGREVAVLPKMEGAGYFSLRFSPDSKLVASGGTRDVLLFDIAARKLLHRLPSWGWIAFAPDGKTLASAVTCRIHLWDTATGREIAPRPSHQGPINFLAATPDGRRIVSLSPYGTVVHLWDTASGKSIAALPAGEQFRGLHTGALSADGKRFASGDSQGRVRVWDLGTASEARHLNAEMTRSPAHLNPEIIALSFTSGDNRLTAVSMAWPRIGGVGKRFHLDSWDLNTGKNTARRELPMVSWPATFTGGRSYRRLPGRQSADCSGRGDRSRMGKHFPPIARAVRLVVGWANPGRDGL